MFTSSEFMQFMEGNGMKHPTTSPYHPSSNGLAERAVQVIKPALRSGEGGNVQKMLSSFFFMYHIAPHTTTGVPPPEFLMGRRHRSWFDLYFPSSCRYFQSEKRCWLKTSDHPAQNG